jgi:AraC-like DNA-binding protein
MAFDFNLYSTPLLFGFVQAWVYALLFWWRAWHQERLSDALFGCLLAAFSFEIWEYMLGFAGIEFLWKELEFFPRNFSFLLPPLAYFYLKSQFNRDFRFQWNDLWHALPFLLYVVYHVLIYVQGSAFVNWWKDNIHFPYGIEQAQTVLKFILQGWYFIRAYRLFQEYRQWAPSQFSNVESVSFHWFRNFLIAFLASSVIGLGMALVDFWLQLDFWHDWWSELFNAGLIYYLCIAGYAQTQLRRLHFETADVAVAPYTPLKAEKIPEEELGVWRVRIEQLMDSEKPWMDSELTLSELAKRLQTNASVLSAAINGAFGVNFNDFVNNYRVEAVKVCLKNPENSHLSLLGIGMECGFNSKSTFNRAFRKLTGVSPSEYTGS